MYDTYDEIEEAEIGQVESQRTWWAGYILVGILLLIGCGWFYMLGTGTGLYHRVNHDEFAVVKDVRGNYTVREYGQHWKGFSNVWIYPRILEVRFEHTKATCSDGSTMIISTYTQVELPKTEKEILKLHKSVRSIDSVKDLVKSVVQTSLKYTAPSMTGRELIGSHKAEFTDLVAGQIRDGFYVMEIDKETYQTKFIKDEFGKYIITKPSMLNMFDLTLKQFSVIGVEIPDELRREIKKRAIYQNQSSLATWNGRFPMYYITGKVAIPMIR